MTIDLTLQPPRAPQRRLHGIAGLPRLLDKARATHAGCAGAYVYGPESAADRRLLAWLGVPAEALLEQVADHPDDCTIAAWIDRHGHPRGPQERLVWSQEFTGRLARDDPDRQAYIGFVLAQTGLPTATTTTCEWLQFDDRRSFGLQRRVAVIGAGNVGGALGRRWARLGHDVTFAVRDPGSAKVAALLAATGAGARARPPAEAVAASDLVVLATPWSAVADALANAGDLTGKILIDATNPLTRGPDERLALALGHTTSGAEAIAALAPTARVVKAFNTYGWENLENPHYDAAGDGAPVMFVAGSDPTACEAVAALAEDLGFEPFPAGALDAARQLEPLALLWILHARRPASGPHFTWQHLRR